MITLPDLKTVTQRHVRDTAATINISKGDKYAEDERIEMTAWVFADAMLKGKDPKPLGDRRYSTPLVAEDVEKIRARADEIIAAVHAGERAIEEIKKEVLPSIPDDIAKEAKEKYESGIFLDYCIKAFRKVWLGDSFILQALMYVCTTYFVTNPNEPIHLHPSGRTQAGKTDAVKTGLKFFPPQFYLVADSTPRALYYADEKDVHPDMMVLWDEGLTPEAKEVLRSYLTSWTDGTTRLTTEKENGRNKAIKAKIPPRINLILTCQDGIYDESPEAQDESRLLNIEIRRSQEDELKIIEFIQELEKHPVDISHELAVSHAVWMQMPHAKVTLHKTFDFIVGTQPTTREFKRYLTLLKANALLHNRTMTTEEDVKDVDTFLSYSKPMISATQAARPRDQTVILQNLNTGEWKTAERIQRETGLSYLQTVRGLRGSKGTFRSPSGGLLGDKQVLMLYDPDIQTFSFKLK